MSTRAAVKNKSGDPTPRKAARAHRPVQVHDDQLGWADLEAMREDFELEAASHLRSLAKKHNERLAALARHFGDTLTSLDTRVQAMSLSRYVGDFECDPHRALRALVEQSMRPPAISAVEQSARKRKRVLPSSPAIGAFGDESDVFGTVKKARADTDAASARKTTTGPLRGNSTRATRAANLVSPSSTRKPRLRIRASQTVAGGSAARQTPAAGNFIYRQNESLDPASLGSLTSATGARGTSATSSRVGTAAPTPRQPRLGESIVMRSINGSPLGEFVASDIEDDDEDESRQTEAEEAATSSDPADGVESEEDWDLMDKNEASNVERQSLSKSARKRQQKGKSTAGSGGGGTSKAKSAASKLVKSASARSTVPSASAFEMTLPDGAPSFDALKAKWLNDLKQKLLQSDIGENERQRLEEVLCSMADL